MSGRPPEEIWEESLDEGERRLGRRLPGLAATSFAGGADVLFGLVALFVTTAALAAAMPEETAHVLAAATFGIAFVLITLGRAELFTENFLIPVGSVFAGRASGRSLVRMWAVTLAVNLIGLTAFAALFAVDGVLPQSALDAAGKAGDLIGDRDLLPAFASAVAAGTIMTLFTWVAAAADSGVARLFAALLVGFLLIAPNLNHAIVGFGELILALFANTTHSDGLDLLRNLGVSVAGNFVGGVGLVFTTRLAQVRGEPGTRSGTSGSGR
jgi:formate/nitrite transporter FocA (FNT family)